MILPLSRTILTALLVVCILGGCVRQGGGQAGGRPPGVATGIAGCSLGPTGALKTRTLQAGGGDPVQSRSYQLYVPLGVSARSRLPLLVSLHGLGANGSIQNAATSWSSFDDEEAAGGSGFLLALPNGYKDLWYWGAEDSYDVRFLFQMIAQLQDSGCIDPTRIYVDGWSEGAYMAQRMACASGDPAPTPRASPWQRSTPTPAETRSCSGRAQPRPPARRPES
ncbi:MAG: hypothetical protein J2P45_16865 [Candidatus Dormibacteraeota bacterium]|nr:hypothetical protein [Candidatus Dormibacteraeota bacterium]